MPQKFFIILGVSHKVQGYPFFAGSFHDPDYATIVREIISSNHVDFLGEESHIHVTIAEKIAEDLLGVGHYLNVDPLVQDRTSFRIGETYLPPPVGDLPVDRWVIAENEKREKIWVTRLVERTATTGLLICGFFHAFSVAAKLLNQEFEVEVRTYIPWEKLVASALAADAPSI